MEQIKIGNTVTLKSDPRYVVLITNIRMLTRDKNVYVEGMTREFGEMKWRETYSMSDWNSKNTILHRFYNVKR